MDYGNEHDHEIHEMIWNECHSTYEIRHIREIQDVLDKCRSS